MTSTVRHAARSVADSDIFRRLARAGYAANGIIHILLGTIVLVVSFGGQGQSDQSGAFQAIATAPLGFVALWAVAVALWALGLWHAVSAFLPRGGDGAKKWGPVAADAGKAVAYLAVGGVSASVALGARPQSEQSAQETSSTVLSMPGGPFLLGAAGLVIGGIGIAFVVMGVMRSFRKKMTIPAPPMGTAVTVLGTVGYIAKGVALAIVGILLLVAAVKVDPQEAGGIDGAIRALLALPYGPILGAAVGIGFIAYGVFTVLRARYARLDA